MIGDVDDMGRAGAAGRTGEAPAEGAPGPSPPRPDRRRALTGAAVVIVALAGAGVAVWEERSSVGPALSHLGVGSLAVATVCGLVSVAATYPVWWSVLAGLEVRLPVATGAGIFFTTQLGKYIPGSVWPMVMQMEAGRARGASRRTMITANLVMILLTSTSGLIVAAAVLPFYDAGALARYWWGLAAVPFLAALLHPRALTGVVDFAARLLRRPPMGGVLEWRMELRACAWTLLVWLGMGIQAGVLAADLKGWSFSVLAVGVGAMALAVPLGVLFIPAPAGAGIRDVVLGLVLGSAMPAGQALAVVLASRAIAVVCDLLAAGLAATVLRVRRSRRSRAGAVWAGRTGAGGTVGGTDAGKR